MAGSTTIEIVTRADLLQSRTERPWNDPHGYAELTPRKKAAIIANPCAGGDDEPVQLVGVRDGEVIGKIDFLPGLVNVRGRTVRVHYGSNFFVPPEHRGSLLGVTLILKSQSVCEVAAASGPSQDAMQVYEKLRWFDIPLRRFILVRRSRSVVRRYAGERLLARPAAPVIDAGLALPRAMMRIIGGAGLRHLDIEHADRMPAELDAQLAASDAPIATPRSAAWINWLLEHSFSDDPRLSKRLVIIRDRQGEAVGYVLLRVRFYDFATHRRFPDLMLGSLKDWMIFDRDRLSMSQVIAIAVRELGRMKADAVELCLRPQETPRWLRIAGFMPAGTMHMVFKAKKDSPLADPANQNPADWRIRPADGDSFFG